MKKIDLLHLFRKYYEDLDDDYDSEVIIATFKVNYNNEKNMYEVIDFLESKPTVETFAQKNNHSKSTFANLNNIMKNPLYEGLGVSKKRTLHSNNLQTLDDFKQHDVEDVLAIKGIGEKTIEILENNGITFKNS